MNNHIWILGPRQNVRKASNIFKTFCRRLHLKTAPSKQAFETVLQPTDGAVIGGEWPPILTIIPCPPLLLAYHSSANPLAILTHYLIPNAFFVEVFQHAYNSIGPSNDITAFLTQVNIELDLTSLNCIEVLTRLPHIKGGRCFQHVTLRLLHPHVPGNPKVRVTTIIPQDTTQSVILELQSVHNPSQASIHWLLHRARKGSQ